MELERDTNPYPLYGYTSKEAREFEIDHNSSRICVRYKNYGGQNSSFVVYLDWSDIESAIQQFVEIQEPAAVSLQKARQLSEAIADYVALRSPPQSN